MMYSTVQTAVPGFVRSIKQLRIKSLRQHVINKTTYVFDGAVEILVDQKFHLWADHVELDKAKGTLIANSVDQGPVSLENNDFVIVADRLFLDFTKKTGYADNISIHVDEGFLSAARAEKKNDLDWYLEDMMYTPCDKEEPHWHFNAQRAMMHGSYLIKASNLVFKVGKLPLFIMPRMVFPIQGRSKSGFLIPKFSYDYVFGFGIKQEYYWHVHRHCDTTMGIDWRQKRGVVFSDEFRWARAPDNFTMAHWWYAVARNSFVQRNDEVMSATARRYWITGKDFRSFDTPLGPGRLSSLTRVDFGTDKRIGYTFFNSLDEVDDAFNNSWILRSWGGRDLLELKLDDIKTNMKVFSDFTQQEKLELKTLMDAKQDQKYGKTNRTYEKKEREDRVHVAYFPHVEWNCACKNVGFGVRYRHDLFFDQVFYRQRESERFYFNARLLASRPVIPFNKTDMLRLCYKGNLYRCFNLYNNSLKFFVQPHVQLRSHVEKDEYHHKNVLERGILGKGAYRLFLDYGAEWALPEGAWHSENYRYMHYFQPVIQWQYVPKFYQDHWFYIDRRDRAYPKNELSANLRNNIVAGPLQCDLTINQGFDFYEQKDIFYLRRGIDNGHVLPLYSEISFGGDPIAVSFAQEYDWRKSRLLQSEIHTTFFFNKFHLGVGYLFQNEQAQLKRDLLSNIPHFLTVNLAIPLSKNATLFYDSQFYSESDKHYAALSNMRPLLHRVRLDYSGHCWGCYIGFEQKQYRENGVGRSDKEFVFSLRLDSLGSFAKKFKGVPPFKRADNIN